MKLYKIVYIRDIATIDEDDFEEFVSDLRRYYRVVRPLAKSGLMMSEVEPNFTFVPDGKGEANIKLIVKDKK